MCAKLNLIINPISLDGEIIPPSKEATHVGVVRSSSGNGPNIASRLSAHRKAVFSVLHSGIALHHRANPAASLRVESCYGVPVLLSGLATLVLTTKEEKILDQHFKVHIERLLRLHQSTPSPVVFFIAGCLPFTARLHMRMLSLFGQLCRLRDGNNLLAKYAANLFSSATPAKKSWFWKLRG